ncbi:bifunctional biotin--[acetyl-CoA-carboxylase] synthetase/biotin operon repressor, partial [Roseburia faecis]|nr:bifunctional biotin--[acetyl-CoA-carboxylase] synthetase/biotin operon repressor [Roseburia faecis]
WVNDIYLDDKKFVGILAETSLNPTQEAQVIIGVGINFSISQFPTEIEERATSLFYNEQASISRSELIAEIWSEFHR